jgi:hypothetical protein
MNWCRETTKMVVPPGNRPAVPRDWFRGVPKRYVAGADNRGRQEGRPYPWSQQVIHEISGLIAKALRIPSQNHSLSSSTPVAVVGPDVEDLLQKRPRVRPPTAEYFT